LGLSTPKTPFWGFWGTLGPSQTPILEFGVARDHFSSPQTLILGFETLKMTKNLKELRFLETSKTSGSGFGGTFFLE
jgi:hypothetical protein